MDTLDWLVMYGFPLVIGALVVRWIRIIKNNTNLQVEQNKAIISILKDIQTKRDEIFLISQKRAWKWLPSSGF